MAKKDWLKKLHRIPLRKLAFLVVLCSFSVPIVFCVYRIIALQGFFAYTDEGRTEADYFLMLWQCAVGLAAMFLPGMLARRFKFEIPTNYYVLYLIFLYGSIFLGEVHHFYYTVPHWDVVQHAFSGLMLGFFGFSLIAFLNGDEHSMIRLSPSFVAIFAFCFAVSLGVLWEICEFAIDGVLGFNMQKFASAGGVRLIGRAALVDTMKDLIVDCAAAFAATFSGYLSLKYKKGWLHRKVLEIQKKAENIRSAHAEKHKTSEGD